MKVPDVCYDVLSPVKFLGRSAAVYPDKVAIVHGDKRFTYSEFTRTRQPAGQRSQSDGRGKR